jgi:Tn3 transposase DDE domain
MRFTGSGFRLELRGICFYSQLKTCSSSEVAFMLEGLLRHGTEMEVEKNYVDSGGQSEVGFAFCHLLGFHLLPRLKGIHRQKLYRPLAGHPEAYPHLLDFPRVRESLLPWPQGIDLGHPRYRKFSAARGWRAIMDRSPAHPTTPWRLAGQRSQIPP